MASDKRVAIITGGASGLGLAVAQALSARSRGTSTKKEAWDLRLVDMNKDAGEAACRALNEETSGSPSATFHQADCTDYSALASVFETVFQSTGRLDFVFANAGIVEKPGFYQRHDDLPPGKAPEAPNLLVSKICLEAVYTTTYLAQHFFRQTPREVLLMTKSDQSIVVTASSAGIYPSGHAPLYTAAKHGVVGFMRSISPSFYKFDGVRANAICPGPVRTNLQSSEKWDRFPQEILSTVQKVAAVVTMLIDGRDPGLTTDDKTRGAGEAGTGGDKDQAEDLLWGKAVEISGQNHYYRNVPEFSDESMKQAMLRCDPTWKT